MTKRFGVLAAMPVELENLMQMPGLHAQKLELPGFYRVYRTQAGAAEAYFACSGIGKVNAAACAQRLIDAFSVDAVINMGIAGGISQTLHTLDVVIGSEVFYHDFTPPELLEKYYPFQKSYFCDEALAAAAGAVCAEVLPAGQYVTGPVASGDRFVESAAEKARIRALGALCCEMEGAAVGHVCHLNRVPFLILRSISDLADDEAPMLYSEFEKKAALQANAIVSGLLTRLGG